MLTDREKLLFSSKDTTFKAVLEVIKILAVYYKSKEGFTKETKVGFLGLNTYNLFLL